MIVFNKNLGISSEDVAKCTDIYLLKKWKLSIEEDLVSIGLQISKAKCDALVTGRYADPNWYRSVDSARKLQGLLKQQVIQRISYLKHHHARNLEQHFVDVAFEKLSSDLFQEIKAEAMRRIELTQDSS